MARFGRLRQQSSARPGPAAEQPPLWQAQALEAVGGAWLRLDSDLRVVEASAAAAAMLEAPPLPERLINVTRIARLDAIAREVQAGASGLWEIDAAHHRKVLRVTGGALDGNGAVLHLEDITELRRLEAVRADFVANLAHELRTPVASLSLAAETLSGELPPAEARQFVERIAEEARYIEGILRTVTELAILEGHVALQLSDFALRDVVEESWRRVEARLGEAALSNAVPADLTVRADRVKVMEVLQNLLDNAHRYASLGGGGVGVSATKAAGLATVAVSDDGPGIPPADLDRVFERFYKVDRARTRQGEGSGLGLALSKHLVSAHGGTIWAESGPDAGAVVTFTLPDRPA